MSIQDYILDVKEEWFAWYRARPASEVLLGPAKEINWPQTLEHAGYYSYQLDRLKHWDEIHRWCEYHIGKNHYAWTGSIFWFERHEDAVFFKLRWA